MLGKYGNVCNKMWYIYDVAGLPVLVVAVTLCINHADYTSPK